MISVLAVRWQDNITDAQRHCDLPYNWRGRTSTAYTDLLSKHVGLKPAEVTSLMKKGNMEGECCRFHYVRGRWMVTMIVIVMAMMND